MKEIEKITAGSRLGVHKLGEEKARSAYMLSIQYRDGSQNMVLAESKCVGFLRTGFLAKKNRDWLFFDPDGKLVATKPAKELGQCSEIGLCQGMDNGFYIFVKDDGTETLLDGTGETIVPPSPFVGAKHEYFLRHGATPVIEGMKSAMAQQAQATEQAP